MDRDAQEDARRIWRALLADPSRDDLVARIVGMFEADLDAAAQRLIHAPVGDGGEAVAAVLRDVFVLVHVHRERVPWQSGPYWLSLLSILGDENRGANRGAKESDEDEDTDTAAAPGDRLDVDDPFYAWDLAARAGSADPATQSRLADAALDAFEAIVDAPRDPGNDEGPMCGMALVLDPIQLERAWSIARRMMTAGWIESSTTAAHLVSRAAALGRWTQVSAWLGEIEGADARALALGFVAGWSALSVPPRPLVAAAHEAWLTGSGLVELVRGLTRVLDPDTRPPSPSVVHECLRRVVAQPDVAVRDGALILLECWHGIGDTELWLRAIESGGEACRVHATWSLASSQLDLSRRVAVTQLALERTLSSVNPEGARWLGEHLELIISLPVHEARKVFVALLASAPRDGSWPLRSLSDPGLRSLVTRLGGPDAVSMANRALHDVEGLLA